MHELPLNQAFGLRGLATPVAPQALAVVAHGDNRTEQPLLWRLCGALNQLGYNVSVLDATVAESTANPGLLDLLDYSWATPAPSDNGPIWQVLPAALGLQSLCAPGSTPALSLQRLGQAFESNTLVLLYAGVNTLVQLLGRTGLRPLLCVSGEKGSLLTTYLALKRLLGQGQLDPTLLNMVREGPHGHSAAAVAQALQDCARNFLAHAVHPVRIDPLQAEGPLEADMRHLATGLLGHAVPLLHTAPTVGYHGAGPGGLRDGKLGFGDMSRSH